MTYRLRHYSHANLSVGKFGVVSRYTDGVGNTQPQFFSILNGYIERDPSIPYGSTIKVTHRDTEYITVDVTPPIIIDQEKGGTMKGNVYEGVVVKTTKIPAGEGVNDSVDKSEIVHTVAAFIANDDAMATARILAGAIAKGVKEDDPTAPIEVKFRKF